MIRILLALLVLLPAAARAACTKITMPTDFAAVTSGTRANLKANFTEIETRVDNCIDSVDEVRARLSGYSTSLAITSLENLRLRLDGDASSTGKLIVEGSNGDTLFRVSEDSTARFFGALTGTNLTLSGTATTTGIHTFTAAPVLSSATASRLLATDGSKGAASVADLTSWIAGTSNQITSTSDGDGSLTLSLPSAVTFPGSAQVTTTLGVTGVTTLATTNLVGGGLTLDNGQGINMKSAAGTTRQALVVNGTNNLEIGGTVEGGINFYTNLGNLRGSISSAGAWSIGGTLEVDGTSYFTGAASMASTLGVTGDLTLGTAAGGQRLLRIDGAAGAARGMWLRTGGNDRWGLYEGTSAESGSDAGSPLRLSAYTDAGTFIDNVLDITRAAGGAMAIARPVTMSSTLGVTGAATFTAAPVFSSATANQTLEVNGSKALTSVAQTGTGSYVKATSPTITTPTFSGTVASGLTASRTVVTDGSGNFAVSTETGTGSHVRATSPTISGLTLSGTTATGLTASRTLITDGSGNMAVNTETGTGSHVRATSPTLVTPNLGVASATSIALGGNEAFTYDEGSFTATLTGVSGTVTGTAYYVKIGKQVTLSLPALTGTSNASTCTITGLPFAIQGQGGDHIIRLMDNGTAYINSIYIENNSTMTLYSPSGGFGTGFTSSGTKGLTSNTNITYYLQ